VTNNTGNKRYRDKRINNSNEKNKNKKETRTPTRIIRLILCKTSCSTIGQEKESYRRKNTTSYRG